MQTIRSYCSTLRLRETYEPTWRSLFLSECYFVKSGIHRAIRRHAHRLTGEILDYGCGQQPYRHLFQASRYIGLDVEISGHPEHQKTADLYFDGTTIPLPADSVDAVLATEVLEHVFEVERALSEMNRVLRPGGVLLVTCPFAWPVHEAPYDVARYTQFALSHLLSKTGFELEIYEKEISFVPAVNQLALLYCLEHLRPKNDQISAALRVIYATLFNGLGFIGEKLLPKGWEFYLCNVAVAVKKPAQTDTAIFPPTA